MSEYSPIFTRVATPIRPWMQGSQAAIIRDKDLRGGYRIAIDLSERDGIPLYNAALEDALPESNYRVEGMVCYVVSEKKSYRLEGGVGNEHWVEINGLFFEHRHSELYNPEALPDDDPILSITNTNRVLIKQGEVLNDVTTRIQNPTNGYYAVWDDANKRLNFVPSSGGEDGLTPELRFNTGWVQWKYTTDINWINLYEPVDGIDGEDGETPHIGLNNNWWIGTTDTGIKAIGEDGSDGDNGHTPYVENDYWYINGVNTNVLARGTNGTDGDDGLSAYEIAVLNGFVGTELQWLDSLNGNDGLSAYQIWLNNGNSGTESDFLNSLVGAPGQDGDDGVTPSHQWNGSSLRFTNPDGSWGTYINLKGNPGDPGDPGSAATIALGTVETGNAGTNVIITNSGTSSAAVFNFTIPKGDAGDPGADGLPPAHQWDGTSLQFQNPDGTWGSLVNLIGEPTDVSHLVPKVTEITINGVKHDLSQNRSWTVAGLSQPPEGNINKAGEDGEFIASWLYIRGNLHNKIVFDDGPFSEIIFNHASLDLYTYSKSSPNDSINTISTDFNIYSNNPSIYTRSGLLFTPTDDNHLVNKKYVDDQLGSIVSNSSVGTSILNRSNGSGGWLSTDLGVSATGTSYNIIRFAGQQYSYIRFNPLDLNIGALNIINTTSPSFIVYSDAPTVYKLNGTLFTPTNDNHLVNKKYVDDQAYKFYVVIGEGSESTIVNKNDGVSFYNNGLLNWIRPSAGNNYAVRLSLSNNSRLVGRGSSGIGTSAVAISLGGILFMNGTQLTTDTSNLVPTSRTITIDGVSHNLSANRNWSILPAGATNSILRYNGVNWVTSEDLFVNHVGWLYFGEHGTANSFRLRKGSSNNMVIERRLTVGGTYDVIFDTNNQGGTGGLPAGVEGNVLWHNGTTWVAHPSIYVDAEGRIYANNFILTGEQIP